MSEDRNSLNFMNDSKPLSDTKLKSGWAKIFFLELYLKDILEGAMGEMSVIIPHCAVAGKRNEHKSIP